MGHGLCFMTICKVGYEEVVGVGDMGKSMLLNRGGNDGDRMWMQFWPYDKVGWQKVMRDEWYGDREEGHVLLFLSNNGLWIEKLCYMHCYNEWTNRL